jgi:colanic acid/amylovoran biosynthesis glycosyltransferase
MSKQSQSIAYVLQTYPGLTLTFIYREVLALERKGFNIATFATWKPDKDSLSQESWHLMDSTWYIFPISWPKFFLAHLYFLLTRPTRYVGTALFALTRRGQSPKKRLRTAFHFGEAVYLAKEIEKRDIKHLHAHFAANAATIALVVSRLLGTSFSFTAHNTFFIYRLILKEKIREARFIVAISEFSRQFLINLVPGEDWGHKIHIVHCGLSLSQFLPPNPKPVNDVPMILFVAQLAERKGAPILVEACKILAERGVSFRCVIVGDGPQRALVEQLVEQYALQSTVELVGTVFQEELKAYFNQADIFALPCLTASNGDMDGIPVALMEAMAMEIANVSTFVSGIPELIEDQRSGLLVKEKDAVALAGALQRLLEDEALRRRLGKNGRQKVLDEFDIDQNAAQLANLFERYLKGNE